MDNFNLHPIHHLSDKKTYAVSGTVETVYVENRCTGTMDRYPFVQHTTLEVVLFHNVEDRKVLVKYK